MFVCNESYLANIDILLCKAVDRGMVMGDVKLLEKSGGKSGEWKAGK